MTVFEYYFNFVETNISMTAMKEILPVLFFQYHSFVRNNLIANSNLNLLFPSFAATKVTTNTSLPGIFRSH